MTERGLYLLAYAALMALLGLTMLAAQFDLGAFNVAANLIIAAVKTGIVAWVYMHLREDTALTRFLAGAVIFWIALLIAGILIDTATR